MSDAIAIAELTSDQLAALAARAIYVGRVNQVIAAAHVSSARLIVTVNGETHEIVLGPDFVIWPERTPTAQDPGLWSWAVKDPPTP